MTISLKLPGNLVEWGELLTKGAVIRLAQEVYNEKLDNSMTKDELLKVLIALETEKRSSEGVGERYLTLPEETEVWDGLLSKNAIIKIAEDSFQKKLSPNDKKETLLGQLKDLTSVRTDDPVPAPVYASKEEVNELKEKLDQIMQLLKNGHTNPKPVAKATDPDESGAVPPTFGAPLRAARTVWPASTSKEESIVLAKLPGLGDDANMSWTPRELTLLATLGRFKPLALDAQRGSKFLSDYNVLKAIKVERPNEEVISAADGFEKITEKLVNFNSKCREAGLNYTDYGQALRSYVHVSTYSQFKPQSSVGRADRFYELVCFLLRNIDLGGLKMQENTALSNLKARDGKYLRDELLRMLDETERFVYSASITVGISKITETWRVFNHPGYVLAMTSGADMTQPKVLREMLMTYADASVKLTVTEGVSFQPGVFAAVGSTKSSSRDRFAECPNQQSQTEYWGRNCLCARCDVARAAYNNKNANKKDKKFGVKQLNAMVAPDISAMELVSVGGIADEDLESSDDDDEELPTADDMGEMGPDQEPLARPVPVESE